MRKKFQKTGIISLSPPLNYAARKGHFESPICNVCEKKKNHFEGWNPSKKINKKE